MLQETSLLIFPFRKKTGFTLIEIMVVMAIIGALAMAVMPSVKLAINKSKDTALMSKLSLIDGAGKVFYLDKGTYPKSLEELQKEKYIPDKDYVDSKGQKIKYDSKTGFASGLNSQGKVIYSDQSQNKNAGSP